MHFLHQFVRAFAVGEAPAAGEDRRPLARLNRHWLILFSLVFTLAVLPAIMFAQAPAGKVEPKVAAPASAGDSNVIYPRNAAQSAAPATAGNASSGSNSMLLVVAAGAAAAGGWMLWRQRRTPSGIAGRDARKLAVSETRSLGNRQYLVVADYDGKKFLLGVCPGRIDLLSPLEASPPVAEKN
jgi:flagellar protein FliO/FliZ